jgi:hypothetical protein
VTIAMQLSKDASTTTEGVFSVGYVLRLYMEGEVELEVSVTEF